MIPIVSSSRKTLPFFLRTSAQQRRAPCCSLSGLRASSAAAGTTTTRLLPSAAAAVAPTRNRLRPLSSSSPVVPRCTFSTAASAASEPATDEDGVAATKKKNKKRRSGGVSKIADKDPIVVTERAAERIRELLRGENAEGALGIRLGVKRRGCNGLSYTLNYAFEKPEKDVEMTTHGITVFIEPMALFSVVGTTMDWEETELTSEFTFQNPNSKGECGCGESFNV